MWSAMASSSHNKFDYNLIRYLVAIIETRSMVNAAEVLGVAPAAVTYAAKKLRDHYDDPLFIRSMNGVKPTTLALSLYERFRSINEDIAYALNVSSLAPESSRKLYIRTDSLMEFWLSDCLISSGVVPEECSPVFRGNALMDEDRATKLRNHEVDIDIGLPISGERNIISETLIEWEFVLVCRRGHKTIGDTITKEQFAKERYLAYTAPHIGSNIYTDLNSLFDLRLTEPCIISESPLALVLSMVRHDFLLIIPRLYLPLLEQIISIKEVGCDFIPPTRRKIMAHYHKKNSNDPLIRKIITLLSESNLRIAE